MIEDTLKKSMIPLDLTISNSKPLETSEIKKMDDKKEEQKINKENKNEEERGRQKEKEKDFGKEKEEEKEKEKEKEDDEDKILDLTQNSRNDIDDEKHASIFTKSVQDFLKRKNNGKPYFYSSSRSKRS